MSQASYAAEIARLIQQQGEARANATRQSGEIWGGAIANLGQIPTQLVQQRNAMQRAKLQQQELALQTQKLGLEVGKERREWDASQAFNTAMSAGLNPDGTFNQSAVVESLAKANQGASIPKFQKMMSDADKAGIDAQKARDETAAHDANFKGMLAAGVKANDYSLPSFMLLLTRATAGKQLKPEEAQQALEMAKSDPNQIKRLTDTWLAESPEQTKLSNETAKTQREVEEAAARLPGIKADAAVKQQVAEGTVGGITPEQRAQNELRAKTEARTAAQGAERNAIARARLAQARKSGGDTEGLVRTVIDNPELFDQLTPTEKGKIAPRLNELGYTGFGKTLPPTAVKALAESQTAIDSLNDLKKVLKENEQYIGPIAGLQALYPYSDARKAQANINMVRQRVGKALEGGVLRKEDEEKYKTIIATVTDTPSTAIYKIDSLIKNVETDIQNYKNELRLSGRRVGESEQTKKPAEKKNPFVK